MASVIYLGVEGVLFARRCPAHIPRYHLEAPHADPLPLLERISGIADEHQNLSIVINSWWVVDYGYRSVLNLLPDAIARRTIGATIQGNRVHRRVVRLPRVDILRADIKRRHPSSLVIVDASSSAIPFEYLSESVLIRESSQETASKIEETILDLLGRSAASALYRKHSDRAFNGTLY
ncbi:HAD domain-containing protein [Caballeronia mineralivorans]|jgi:hypothetical protein|uniref:HAD domain-containing protein n=1 Tax=Caballeronia mineralivorans TaxID=2010198 RepID=UPI002B0021AF|nr:HAD domain-containing protein [Caballeronia mineralivorans]MEA3102735.1 hypothetical protein [Caballeronia mineralivorans]